MPTTIKNNPNPTANAMSPNKFEVYKRYPPQRINKKPNIWNCGRVNRPAMWVYMLLSFIKRSLFHFKHALPFLEILNPHIKEFNKGIHIKIVSTGLNKNIIIMAH